MSSQVPSVAEIASMPPADLEVLARRLDGERRRVEAALATLVDRVASAGAFGADGHRSVKAWGRATCNWSGGEASRFVKTGRMLSKFESAATAAAAGEIGVAQMHALGQLVANPRVAEHLADSEELLVGQATVLDYDDYITLLAHWEALADADGAHDDHERAHRDRNAHMSIVGERFFLDANGGAVAGVELMEVFEQFCRSEWLADWEAGVAVHGEAMVPRLMERTDAQRRFDALKAIFGAAAVSGQSPTGEPVVNLIVGYELFEHHLRRALGEHPAPLDPNNPAHRCETADGVVIDPYDMLVAAALGQVRRIVLDTAGVIVDVGRKQRLFTGALRDAVMLL
ncbi:MAG: 13E12 repeat family protein, partial [Actinomycetia bacterium]|nr:13E12 repeat family protein [Actinomycetes bacterium]